MRNLTTKADLSSVSCVPTGDCTAGGDYMASVVGASGHYQGFVT